MKKIIVIKLGRSIATTKRNKLDLFRFEQLAKQIKLLHENHFGVVIVVSAAVSCGEKIVGSHIMKHLVAGVGQVIVTAGLIEVFSKHNIVIGQLLLTNQDLQDFEKKQNIKQVLHQAIDENIVIVANENDIVELNSFNGNDYLAVAISKLVAASNLLLLTDVEGVLSKDMEVIREYTKEHSIGTVKKQNNRGQIGGLTGKLEAANQAADTGINTWVVNGKTQNLLSRMILENEHIGTKIIGKKL